MNELTVDQLFGIAEKITELRLSGDPSVNAQVVSLLKQLRFGAAADWILFEERIFANQSDLFKKARAAGIWEELPPTISGLAKHALVGRICPKRFQFTFFNMLGNQFMMRPGEIGWNVANILNHLPFKADYPLMDLIQNPLFLHSANDRLFQKRWSTFERTQWVTYRLNGVIDTLFDPHDSD